MTDSHHSARRCFHAHETAQALRLNGLPLASFWQRLFGYVVDLILAILLWIPLELAWRYLVLHQQHIDLTWDFHEAGNVLAVVLYFGLGNYWGNGQTPGKRLARTRAVSLSSDRIGLWQSIERALGYGAAILEGGLGFVQFFWDPNRMCAQDRLAETIVIDLRPPGLDPKHSPQTRTPH